MNNWSGIGRLVEDPRVTYTQEQMAIARYRVAVDRAVAKDGKKEADFIPCIAFGKKGEFAEKYLKKGMKIAITGSIQTGSYTNKDGAKIYTTDVIISSQEFCEKKSNNESPSDWKELDQETAIGDEIPFN